MKGEVGQNSLGRSRLAAQHFRLGLAATPLPQDPGYIQWAIVSFSNRVE